MGSELSKEPVHPEPEFDHQLTRKEPVEANGIQKQKLYGPLVVGFNA
jgi:hypothetical protein